MKLPVSVCLPDGTSVEMLIGKSDSCFDVKKQISEETGLISFDVHYIGRVLSADEVLADTGLTEGEEIYIHPTIINNKLTTIPITGDQLITEVCFYYYHHLLDYFLFVFILLNKTDNCRQYINR